jgi:hypothetical protein
MRNLEWWRLRAPFYEIWELLMWFTIYELRFTRSWKLQSFNSQRIVFGKNNPIWQSVKEFQFWIKNVESRMMKTTSAILRDLRTPDMIYELWFTRLWELPSFNSQRIVPGKNNPIWQSVKEFQFWIKKTTSATLRDLRTPDLIYDLRTTIYVIMRTTII